MPDQTKFKHITVNADDEEVIIVGTKGDMSSSASSDSVISHQASSDDSASEPLVDEESVATDIDATDSKQKASKKSPVKYHETTLEDIESTHMGTTQKVIIVLAILAVIAFVFYYIFFL